MILKTHSPARLVVLVPLLLALSAVCSRATSFTYDLTFNPSGSFSMFGSGTMIFDDTPVAPHTVVGATGYDFVAVNGSGSLGVWTGSWLDYDSATGEFYWIIITPGGTGSILNGPGGLSPGLTPVEAMDSIFNIVQPSLLTWQRGGASVPDSTGAIALLGIGLAALAAARRRLR